MSCCSCYNNLFTVMYYLFKIYLFLISNNRFFTIAQIKIDKNLQQCCFFFSTKEYNYAFLQQVQYFSLIYKLITVVPQSLNIRVYIIKEQTFIFIFLYLTTPLNKVFQNNTSHHVARFSSYIPEGRIGYNRFLSLFTKNEFPF